MQAGLGDVVRSSATVVTITLPAVATYDITAPETITATIPAAALVQSGSDVVATPTFPVTVAGGTAALTGTVTDDSETDIRTGGSTIVLPAFATYDITAAETITATIPAAALVQAGADVAATPTFPVTVED